jgi:hypothetical protein
MADTDLFLQLEQQKRRSPTRPESAGGAVPKTQASRPARLSKPADHGAAEKTRSPKVSRKTPPKKDNKLAPTHASTLARYPDSTIERIRKTVRMIGREVAFTRLTPAEKQQLAEIVYTYKRQGIKTSENEVVRVAVAFLLADYQESNRESVLARVIDALNA